MTGTRVFLARLANVGVFDSDGDQFGKVRDAVARFRPDDRPMRVIGFVVDIQQRRPIFVPMGRIRAFDPDGMVAAGSLSMKRFERRPDEVLVLGEMLDRRVRVRGRVGEFEVVDLGMEQQRNLEWRIERVAVAEVRRGPFRRQGQVFQVHWGDVSGFTAGTGQGAATLLATYSDLPPADLATALQDLPDSRRQQVAEALDDERLADVLEELPEDDQVEILGQMDQERAADVLEAMDPDAAADLLGELDPDARERLLQRMEPDEAEPVRRLLQYEWSTAGGLMNPEPIVLPPDATVAQALARIRDQQVTPALAAQVYVCRPPTVTPTGRYLGTAHFQRLLREPPGALVSGVVDGDIDPLRPETTLAAVTAHFATYNLVAAPVVDEHQHLLGTVTVDDVLDHLLPDNWRDTQRPEAGHV